MLRPDRPDRIVSGKVINILHVQTHVIGGSGPGVRHPSFLRDCRLSRGLTVSYTFSFFLITSLLCLSRAGSVTAFHFRVRVPLCYLSSEPHFSPVPVPGRTSRFRFRSDGTAIPVPETVSDIRVGIK